MAQRIREFVVNGALSREYLIDVLGVPANRISAAGHTYFAPAPYDQRPEAGRHVDPGEPLRYLLVGRLVPRKGPEHVIRAAGQLRRRFGSAANFEVVMVGDGPMRSSLAELAAEQGISDVVKFEGYKLPDDVWPYYAHCHVLVLPTLQDNWPVVVLEAMAMGMPVLLSRIAGSVPDLIRDGQNGYAFDAEDDEQLANLMATYLERPELVEMHGQKSLEQSAPYAPARNADVYMNAIERVLAKPEATRPELR
jgi:glycosyltransferase involved in cell wall biosynthesis